MPENTNQYDHAAVCKLVESVFGDEELNALCHDHFPEVYSQFTAGQNRGHRIGLLVEFAGRHGCMDKLVDIIKKANPFQYDRFLNFILKSRSGEKTATEKRPAEPSKPLLFSVSGRRIDGPVQAGVIEHLTQHFYLSESSRSKPDTADRSAHKVQCQGEPAVAHSNKKEPMPHANPRKLIHPGGPLDVDSQVYIKRDTDEDVIDELSMPRGLVTVQAPSQSGKTSLMLRIHVNAKKVLHDNTIRSVFVDFQALPQRCFESLECIWRAIVQEISIQLSLVEKQTPFWNDNDAYDRNMNGFLDHYVFEKDVSSLLLCLDEVDRVFTTSVKTEFFASIRAFYGRGAFDDAWKRMRWLLNTSSEPAFFIEDINQSPFNVGEYVRLRPFTAAQVHQLARCHGLDLSSELLNQIMRYLGGRPYLTHLLFYRMAKEPRHCQLFFDGAKGGQIFLKHLKRYLKQFQKDTGLAQAFKNVIQEKGCQNEMMAERLEAAGLAKRDAEQNVVSGCELYSKYFGKMLK